MAYMNQEKKAKIVAELKKVIPREWKYSVSVQHHSTIILTIKSAPVDLKALAPHGINEFHLNQNFSGELLKTFEAILVALNLDNHDNSDYMTDYYDVGHYVAIKIGRWDLPFVHKPTEV